MVGLVVVYIADLVALIDAKDLEVGGQVDRLFLSPRRRLPSSLLLIIASHTAASGFLSSGGFGS